MDELIESCHIRVENEFLAGSPICFKFDPPLTDDTLQRFIKHKLGQWCKIWGNPLWRGKVCQLYGLDLVDNARIDIQMDSEWFTVFIPESTPASVIERLVENIRKYLTPHFTVYTGEKELVKY